MQETASQVIKYHLAKAYYSMCLRISDLPKKTPIIVYQMGKVGSKTVVKSLEDLHLRVPIHHVHWLTKNGLDNYESRTKSIYRSHPGKHFWVGHHLRKQIDGRLNCKEWNIVTLVRDPIARNLSAFFHTMDLWYPKFNEEYIDQPNGAPFKELVNVFLEKFPHDIPLVWLDSEMRKIFGMDVYCNKFPTSKGYEIYRENMTKLLLIRLEDLNRRACEAFSTFLETERFSLVNVNVSEQKEHGHIYRKFLDSVNLPESYLDYMYSSKYARHFYTAEEIESFKNRWSKN